MLIIEYLLYSISILSLSLWVFIWMMHLCALTNAKLKLNKSLVKFVNNAPPNCKTTTTSNGVNNDNNDAHNSITNLPLPGVSIIKPLVGIDANLHANLETFFHMNYPTYELLFCVHDPDDAAILIVKNLFRMYPDVDAKLFVGGAIVGVNPKINNMQPAYESIKYELVLISDSGISMKDDTLLDMVYHMHDDVALVHQMPFVCDGRQGFQSIVEKVYFGTVHARAYLTADLLNINCPTGMSALMRKHLLDEVGGIKAFGQYLAEDFFFAKSFTDRGWKISISSQPAWQNSDSSSDTLNTLNSRIQRWVKLRFAMVPQWTLMEPFSECMLLGLLGAMSISFLWALDPFAIFLFHILLWFLFDYKLLCTIQNGPLAFSKTEFIIAWLIRECTALLVFLKALADPRVTWRSRIFKLKWGGFAEEVFLENTNSLFDHHGQKHISPSENLSHSPTHRNKLKKSCPLYDHVVPFILYTEQAFKNDLDRRREENSIFANDLEDKQLAVKLIDMASDDCSKFSLNFTNDMIEIANKNKLIPSITDDSIT